LIEIGYNNRYIMYLAWCETLSFRPLKSAAKVVQKKVISKQLN